MSTRTRTAAPSALLHFVLAFALVLSFGTRDAWSQLGNPPLCNNPLANIQIQEFHDVDNSGTINVPPDVQLFPFTEKTPGQVILYRARLFHTTNPADCGFEQGRVCIDIPMTGCGANPTFDPPSFTTDGPNECCAADIGNPVPLVCPLVAGCAPAGALEYFSNPVRYVVNPADAVNSHGLCQNNDDLRAHAYYDIGFSKQGAEPGIRPANASIPICNPVPVQAKHFMCYEHRKKNFNRTVSLVDRFRPGGISASVREGKRICTPADKNDEDPNIPPFPDEHLEAYEMTTPASPNRKVEVANQFGTAVYDIQRATRLMVPTAKSLNAGVVPPALAPLSIDHYECYTAKGVSVDETVTIEDQFFMATPNSPPVPLIVDVRQPDFVCVPANKNNEGFATQFGALGLGLVCYDVNTSPDRQAYKGLFSINNQFEQRTGIEIHGPREICVESSIAVVP